MASLEERRHCECCLKELEEGDLVEFDRGFYYHWGVYIGNEKVVHLTGDENTRSSNLINPKHIFSISGKRYNKAIVKIDNIWDVAKGKNAYINNTKDKERSPLSQEEIVETALSMLGPIKYNVLWNNCEHFAAFCRYGKKMSSQTKSFLKQVGDGALTVITVMGTVALLALNLAKN